jgi:hypothetical protein
VTASSSEAPRPIDRSIRPAGSSRGIAGKSDPTSSRSAPSMSMRYLMARRSHIRESYQNRRASSAGLTGGAHGLGPALAGRLLVPGPAPEPLRPRQHERAPARGVAECQPQRRKLLRHAAGHQSGRRSATRPTAVPSVRSLTALIAHHGQISVYKYEWPDLLWGGFGGLSNAADTVHAARLEQVAVKGAQVVAAAHADPGHDAAACHARMCTSAAKADPGHDAAACHARMTGQIGVMVEDAGYCSEANLTAEGPVDRLIATGSRRTMGKAASDNPASGPPPQDATAAGGPSSRLRWRPGVHRSFPKAGNFPGLLGGLALATGNSRITVRTGPAEA